MPRLSINFTDEQARHIELLADKAGCDDADIVRGLVELDMKGVRKKPVSDEATQLLRMVQAYLKDQTSTKLSAGHRRAGSVRQEANGRWLARVWHDGKGKFLGRHATEQEAWNAVDAFYSSSL